MPEGGTRTRSIHIPTPFVRIALPVVSWISARDSSPPRIRERTVRANPAISPASVSVARDPYASQDLRRAFATATSNGQ